MVHVYPVNDTCEHDTESTQCACNPKVDFSEGEGLVIHNAFDCRELFEQMAGATK